MSDKNLTTANNKRRLTPSDTAKADERATEIPRDLGETTDYVAVDDAVWDAVVAEIMEEYDGAWTRLADL